MAEKKEMDNLAKDAAAALAASMSYGKWKAMQDKPVVVEKKETLQEGWRVCPRCGKAFKPKTRCSKQIYCELACQKAAQRDRDREKYRDYYRNLMREKRAKDRE